MKESALCVLNVSKMRKRSGWHWKPFMRNGTTQTGMTGNSNLEKVRGYLEAEASRHGLRCSLGVASFPDDAKDSKGLIEMADQALYRAKEQGRNRACGLQRAQEGQAT